MATRYCLKCPTRSYAVSREICLARQKTGDSRCRNCRNGACPGAAQA